MNAALDAAVRAHAAAMPDGSLRLLEPVISVDAKDGWLRDALMAYLRYFVRVFEHDEPREAAESALAGFDSVDDRLRFFVADAGDDPEQPHPYAAHLIVNRLAQRILDRSPDDVDWAAVPYPEIRAHAEALLGEDTARLTASG